MFLPIYIKKLIVFNYLIFTNFQNFAYYKIKTLTVTSGGLSS